MMRLPLGLLLCSLALSCSNAHDKSGGLQLRASFPANLVGAGEVTSIAVTVHNNSGIGQDLVVNLTKTPAGWSQIITSVPAGTFTLTGQAFANGSSTPSFTGEADAVIVVPGVTTSVVLVLNEQQAPGTYKLPVISAVTSSSPSIAANGSAALTVQATSFNGALSYAWRVSPNDGFFTANDSTSASSTVYNADPAFFGAHLISITVTDALGLQASASLPLTVIAPDGSIGVNAVLNVCPAINPLSASPTHLTPGQATTLAASAQSAAAALRYSWSVGAPTCAGVFGSDSQSAQAAFTLAAGSSDSECGFVVSVTDPLGCTSTATLVLPVQPASVVHYGPQITAHNQVQLSDGSYALSVSATSLSGSALTYSWSSATGAIAVDAGLSSSATWEPGVCTGAAVTAQVVIDDGIISATQTFTACDPNQGNVVCPDPSPACDGSAGKPAVTCRSLYWAGYLTDGAYWVKPDANAPAFQTWCVQRFDGGGYTLIGAVDRTTSLIWSQVPVASGELSNQKLDDALIDAVWASGASEKRMLIRCAGAGSTWGSALASNWHHGSFTSAFRSNCGFAYGQTIDQYGQSWYQQDGGGACLHGSYQNLAATGSDRPTCNGMLQFLIR